MTRELELLMSRRWILKSDDKELYYKVRDSLAEIRKFSSEKLGCYIMENPLLVKMEKIPAIPESFMGIQDFTTMREYAYLCVLLMFLEDKDAQEQFILSQLTEYISSNMPSEPVNWTIYTNRRCLIKVLRYAVKQGMIAVTDGSDDDFMDDSVGEVLYENTGVSRYFMRNFSNDIMEFSRPEDFSRSEWFEIDEDRGIARRQRVYKRLMFAPGMYRRDGSPEDFEYLKNQGNKLRETLEGMFDCRVHIHKGSAFLISGDGCRMGDVFPGNNVISDILLMCCAEIRNRIKSGAWIVSSDDTCSIDIVEFENMIRYVRKKCRSGFTKNYREMPEGEFVKSVSAEMERWMFVRISDNEHQVIIYPAAGKIEGSYPDDYIGSDGKAMEEQYEQQMAGK